VVWGEEGAALEAGWSGGAVPLMSSLMH
jgi:hypothetical protein